MLTGALILSFYSVIGGWTLDYGLSAAVGRLVGLDAVAARELFADLVADPYRLLASHTLFMALAMLVVARGVAGGLERAIRWLMPMLFILLACLVIFAAQTGDFASGLRYLFEPDFAAFGDRPGEAILSAMGQAFFILSLGMGPIMVYGVYMQDGSAVGRSAYISTCFSSTGCMSSAPTVRSDFVGSRPRRVPNSTTWRTPSHGAWAISWNGRDYWT